MPDIINTTDGSPARAVTLVPEARRMGFLPLLFGRQHVLVAEMTVYHLMERLSPLDYRGGLWDFYERDGRPLYLAPTSKPRLRIEGEITLPLPGLMKMVVGPVVEGEFEKLVDKYIANLVKRFGGEA